MSAIGDSSKQNRDIIYSSLAAARESLSTLSTLGSLIVGVHQAKGHVDGWKSRDKGLFTTLLKTANMFKIANDFRAP
jgi:hypothetical protein